MANYRFFSATGGDVSQLIISTTLNENVTQGDVVRTKVAGANGVLEKADDSGTTCAGIAMATGSTADTINMLQSGEHNVNFIETLTAADVGKTVYVSATPGKATLTAPTASGKTIIKLGYLKSNAGSVFVLPSTILTIS
jgi:hypothetical protein